MSDVAVTGETTLKRTLGPFALVALGIGAIIGAGLFVRTAAAIAERSGPSVTLAFIVAGVGCAFAGLCYAEFASMIPIAGSAYTYSYATMGELIAWIIGWDLILEYAVGAATVAIAWSEYFNRVLEYVGLRVPYEFSHSPFEVAVAGGQHGMINIPAIGILLVLSLLLIRGTQESAVVNNIIVVTKVSIVLMVIVIGWGFMNPANHTPYIPAVTTYTTPQGVTHPYGGIMGDSRRRRCRLLRVHRLRRGLDRGAGGEEPEARHADRHPRLAGRLHHPLRPVLARAERRGHGRGLPDRRGGKRRSPLRSPSTCRGSSGCRSW
jgi:APA family basic amino acid/polyamine antiporter